MKLQFLNARNQESFVRPNWGEFLEKSHKMRKQAAPILIPTSRFWISPSTFKKGPKRGAPAGRGAPQTPLSQPAPGASGQLHRAKGSRWNKIGNKPFSCHSLTNMPLTLGWDSTVCCWHIKLVVRPGKWRSNTPTPTIQQTGGTAPTKPQSTSLKEAETHTEYF